MICITLGTNEKPTWWPKFIRHVFGGDIDTRAIERKEWAQQVNAALEQFGGRMQRNWTHNYFFITFRLDSNYTLFVLKFT